MNNFLSKKSRDLQSAVHRMCHRPELSMQKIRSSTGCIGMVLTAFLLLIPVSVLQAQDIMPVLTPDNEVYIYHNQQTTLGHGYNVYRIVDNEEELLTDDPVYPASNGSELQYFVGDLYQQLAEDLGTESPQETFFTLRGNQSLGRMLSSLYPEYATALGYLFVDENPVTGRRVTYRFEWVNTRGNPTGVSLEETVAVGAEPLEPPPPHSVEAERKGAHVTVSWNYPETEAAASNVMRFNVFLRPGNRDHFQLRSDRAIVRQSGMTAFSYRFRLHQDVTEADFMIQAVDMTGKNTAANDPVRIQLADALQPAPVNEVYLSTKERTIVRLTWPVGREPFLDGYHVDRLDTETDERVRLTEELIPVADPVFKDDTAVEGKTYYYFIIAVSETGVESEDGNPAIAYIESRIPPPSPTALRAAAHPEEKVVDLVWESPEHDELFNTYVILRREYTETGERAFSQVNRGRVLSRSLTDSGIAEVGFTEGVRYEYGVAAANVHGLRSDTVFTVVQMPLITPPEPPSTFQASIDRGVRVNLTWGASSSPSVTSYNVYKNNGERDTLIANTPKNRRFLVDSDVRPGREYLFFATAVDSAGNESPPSRKVDLAMRDFAPPPSVRNVQAVQLNEAVYVRWEPSPDDDVLGYVIKRSDLSNGRYEALVDEPVRDVNWVDTNGAAGHWYRVFAVDESGNVSRPSSPRQAVTRN